VRVSGFLPPSLFGTLHLRGRPIWSEDPCCQPLREKAREREKTARVPQECAQDRNDQVLLPRDGRREQPHNKVDRLDEAHVVRDNDAGLW
jgi:hypothetical protein